MENRLSTRTDFMTVDANARAFTVSIQARKTALAQSRSMSDILAERLGPTSTFVDRFRKTAVGMTTGTANPAHLDEALMALPFLERVASRRLAATIPFLPLPANGFAPVASTAGVATFVAEGAPIPVTRFDVDVRYIGTGKIAIIAVFPDSLLLSPTDRAVSLLERHLGRVVMDGEDAELLSATAAVAGERPAGLLYGKSALMAASVDELDYALSALFASVRGGEANRPWFIMSPKVAMFLATKQGDRGPLFPNVGVAGGNIGGVPVAISKAADDKIILLDADAIGLWDGGMTSDQSDQTALVMNDAPGAGPQNSTSLFQSNATAVMLVRLMNWVTGYSDALNFITVPSTIGSPS